MALRRIVLLAPLPAGRAAFWHKNVKAEELEESGRPRAGGGVDHGPQKELLSTLQHGSADAQARAKRAKEEKAALSKWIAEVKDLERKWQQNAKLARDLRVRYESILNLQHQTLADEEEALALRVQLDQLKDEQENASGPCWIDIGHYIYLRMFIGRSAALQAIEQLQKAKENERLRSRVAESADPAEPMPRGRDHCKVEEEAASESCCKTDCKERWFDPHISTRKLEEARLLKQQREMQDDETRRRWFEENQGLGAEREQKADQVAPPCLPSARGEQEEVEVAHRGIERQERCCGVQCARGVFGIVICSLSACTAIALACRACRLKVRLLRATSRALHWQKEAALEQTGRRQAEQEVEHWKQQAVQRQSLEKENPKEAAAKEWQAKAEQFEKESEHWRMQVEGWRKELEEKALRWKSKAEHEEHLRKAAEKEAEGWENKAAEQGMGRNESEMKAQVADAALEGNWQNTRKQDVEQTTLKATDFESLTREVELSLQEHWQRTATAEETRRQQARVLEQLQGKLEEKDAQLAEAKALQDELRREIERLEKEVEQVKIRFDEKESLRKESEMKDKLEELLQSYDFQVHQLKRKAAEEEIRRKESEKKAKAMAAELRSKMEHEERHRAEVEIAERKAEKWMKKADKWMKKAEEEKSRRKEAKASSSEEGKAKVTMARAFLKGSGVCFIAMAIYAWAPRKLKAIRAVERNPKDANAWVKLGEAGGGKVNGTFHNAKSCFLRALKFNPVHPGAWHGLGVCGGGKVDGAFFPEYSCFVRALELNDKNSTAWYILGIHGGCQVGGVRYSSRECHLRAIALDPEHASAWNGLGECGGATVSGFHYSKRDCHLKALQIDQKHAAAWNRLGQSGGGTLRGKHYSAESCFVKASQLDPYDGTAERNLENLRLADAQ